MLLVKGQFVLLTDENLAAAQRLECKFRQFRGEWFLDTRIGVPYYESIYVKKPNLQLVRRIFRRVILTEAVVATIEELNVKLVGRELQFDFRAVTQSGAVIVGGSGTPFIIEDT